MLKTIYLLLCLPILFYIVHSVCQKDESMCERNPLDENTLYCPKNEPKFEVKVDQYGKQVLIRCYSPKIEESFDLLPKLNLNTVEWVGFEMCNFGNSTSLAKILDLLCISSTKGVMIENYGNFDIMQNLTFFDMPAINLEQLKINNALQINLSTALENMRNLRNLDLNSNRLNLSSEAFSNLVNLETLELSNSKLQTLPDRIFENLQKLQELYLNYNQLRHLPRRIFENLRNLQELDLTKSQLEYLDEDVFGNLTSLQSISLQTNNLSSLATNIFESNQNLTTINLSKNMFTEFPDIFRHLVNLNELELDFCRIRHISTNVFANTINLITLSIRHNELTNLTENLFANATQLKQLDLGFNRLTKIPENVFWNLENLEVLSLNNNNLTEIQKAQFEHLNKLIELNLANNNISYLSSQMFRFTRNLQAINLNNNLLSIRSQSSPFSQLSSLRELHLSHNLISSICMDWTMSFTSLKILDLSHNVIKKIGFNSFQFMAKKLTVDLQYNNISTIDFNRAQIMAKLFGSVSEENRNTVLLSHNPIICDCRLYAFQKFSEDPQVKSMIELKYKNLYCQEPGPLKGQAVSEIDPKEMRCPIDICVDSCTCEFRAWDQSILVNCSHQNLDVLPSKLPFVTGHAVILYVNDNNLKSLDINFSRNSSYFNVQEIYASNNNISEIVFENQPKHLEILELHNNSLTQMNTTFLGGVRQLTLHNNPWNCDCGSTIVSFVQQQYRNIANITAIKCDQNFSKFMMDLTTSDICHHSINEYKLLITALIAICVVLIILILYYKYKMTQSLWQQAKDRNIIATIKSEDLCDVVIMYADKDSKLLTYELVPISQKITGKIDRETSR